MAQYVATQVQPKPKKVAVMYGDNASAQGAFSLLLKPVLDKAGIQVTGIQVKDPGGTAAEVQSAIQNSGADTADVFITLVTQPECIATYDSLKQLGITPTVVTTGLCFGTPMTDHIKDAGETGTMPNGWYFGDYGYNYYAPDLAVGNADLRDQGAAVRREGAGRQDARVHRLRGPVVLQPAHGREARQRDRRRPA